MLRDENMKKLTAHSIAQFLMESSQRLQCHQWRNNSCYWICIFFVANKKHLRQSVYYYSLDKRLSPDGTSTINLPQNCFQHGFRSLPIQKMPFGLKNAQSTSQRIINQILMVEHNLFNFQQTERIFKKQ